LELTSVYSAFANSGFRVAPIAITKIQDHDGNIVYESGAPAPQGVMRSEHAFFISSILSDNQARTPAFGQNSVLNLPFPAAVKTGTTNDFRDNWTVGYTPDLAVGVWVGNADYSPMQDISGIAGAAPIWAGFMEIAVPQVAGGRVSGFSRPVGVIDKVICAVSGTEPSQWCPSQRTEIFAADQQPLPKEEDLWQKVVIDTWTGLKVSSECPDFDEELFVLNVTDPWAIKWIKKDAEGKKWAESMGFKKPIIFSPSRECRSNDPKPKLAFLSPADGTTIDMNPIDIYALADATENFDYFQLEYALGDPPIKWEILGKSKTPFISTEKMFTWDVLNIPPGPVTLRLYMHSTEDTYAEITIRLNLQVPTPTPTPTETATPTDIPTNTPEPTLTLTITPEPSSTPTPTVTP